MWTPNMQTSLCTCATRSECLTIEPRSDGRDLLAIKVKSEVFTEKERPSCCEELQKICIDYLYK